MATASSSMSAVAALLLAASAASVPVIDDTDIFPVADAPSPPPPPTPLTPPPTLAPAPAPATPAATVPAPAPAPLELNAFECGVALELTIKGLTTTERQTPASAAALIRETLELAEKARETVARGDAPAPTPARAAAGASAAGAPTGPVTVAGRAARAVTHLATVWRWLVDRRAAVAFEMPRRQPTRLAEGAIAALRAWLPLAQHDPASATTTLAAAAVLGHLCDCHGDELLDTWVPPTVIAARWHLDVVASFTTSLRCWPAVLAGGDVVANMLAGAHYCILICLRDPAGLVELAPLLGDALFTALPILAKTTPSTIAGNVCNRIYVVAAQYLRATDVPIRGALATIGFNDANIERLVAVATQPGMGEGIISGMLPLIGLFPGINASTVARLADAATLEALGKVAAACESELHRALLQLVNNCYFVAKDQTSRRAIADALLAAPTAARVVTGASLVRAPMQFVEQLAFVTSNTMKHGPPCPARAAFAIAAARRIPDLISAARNDKRLTAIVLHHLGVSMEDHHEDALPFVASRQLQSLALSVTLTTGPEQTASNVHAKEQLLTAMVVLEYAVAFKPAQPTLTYRAVPRLIGTLATLAQSADISVAQTSFGAAAKLSTWDRESAQAWVAAPGALPALLRYMANDATKPEELAAKETGSMLLAALGRYPALLQTHPATREGLAATLAASLHNTVLLSELGRRWHAEALWSMAAWGDEARERLAAVPGLLAALIHAAEGSGGSINEPMGAFAALAAHEGLAVAIARERRLLPVMVRALRSGTTEPSMQTALLLHRLWSHAGAAAVLAREPEALVDVASDTLLQLGSLLIVDADARLRHIALDVMFADLRALVCLSLPPPPLPSEAAGGGGGGGGGVSGISLTAAMQTVDEKCYKRVGMALAELAGLPRLRDVPPIYPNREGFRLAATAALQEASPAEAAELRHLARLVLAVVARGGSGGSAATVSRS